MVHCSFKNMDGGFRCIVQYQNFPSEVNAGTFEGENSRTNDEVEVLDIFNSIFTKFPNNFEDVFKNITSLRVFQCQLTEIWADNLRQFPKLKCINLSWNFLDFLPGNLFQFNRELETIVIENSKIRFIGAELLDGLTKLKLVDLEDNLNINLMFKIDEPAKSNLNRLKEKIRTKCKPPNAYLDKMKERLKLLEVKNVKNESFLTTNGALKNVENLVKDLKKLLTIDEFRDFTIKVNSRDFKVHKFVFTARSETFAAMIKNNPEADELVLEDIEVEIFESILNYVYTDVPPKDPKNGRQIYIAAGKLMIESLKEISAEFLMKEIENNENLDFIMENFNLGLKFKCEKLKLKAFEEIKKHFPGNELKNELSTQPEKLRQLIETKKQLDGLMK